jgi:hypothetical protein
VQAPRQPAQVAPAAIQQEWAEHPPMQPAQVAPAAIQQEWVAQALLQSAQVAPAAIQQEWAEHPPTQPAQVAPAAIQQERAEHPPTQPLQVVPGEWVVQAGVGKWISRAAAEAWATCPQEQAEPTKSAPAAPAGPEDVAVESRAAVPLRHPSCRCSSHSASSRRDGCAACRPVSPRPVDEDEAFARLACMREQMIPRRRNGPRESSLSPFAASASA